MTKGRASQKSIRDERKKEKCRCHVKGTGTLENLAKSKEYMCVRWND